MGKKIKSSKVESNFCPNAHAQVFSWISTMSFSFNWHAYKSLRLHCTEHRCYHIVGIRIISYAF